jgi:ankyrin repeat protein
MQTKTKPDIFEIMASTPEETTELFWEEISEFNSDLQLIEDIFAYTLVDVNVQTGSNWTALMRAAYWGNGKLLELLLSHPKIDVNLQDKGGWTALMYAAYWGKEKSVELLLGYPGIDVNVQNQYNGKTAWDYATDSIRQKFPKLNPNS